MPEVSISIGGRQFEVSCQEGEEDYLHAAAKMLDDEAQVLSDQVGRMPEARMLLMAGLLLADKTASVEDKIKEARAELAERDAELASLKLLAMTPHDSRAHWQCSTGARRRLRVWRACAVCGVRVRARERGRPGDTTVEQRTLAGPRAGEGSHRGLSACHFPRMASGWAC